MHFHQIHAQGSPSCSFEFFPPKTELGVRKLLATIDELAQLEPAFVSITYGAGGSTRTQTQSLVQSVQKAGKVCAVPHLTCIGHTKAEIDELLEQYAVNGVQNILALAGDPPVGQEGYDRTQEDFPFAADLVRHIRDFRPTQGQSGDSFAIGVAGFPEGHPTTPNRLLEMDHLKSKVDSGADFIITQLFFGNHDFHDFRERCELAGIRVPIIAGILPIASAEGMRRMAGLALGARIPAPLLRGVLKHADDAAAVREIGLEWATQQCQDLLDNDVQGIHFYTLNRADTTLELYRRLGIKRSPQLREKR